jgi:hypothetical protein
MRKSSFLRKRNAMSKHAKYMEEMPTNSDEEKNPLQRFLRLVAREVVRRLTIEQYASKGSPTVRVSDEN